MKGLTEIKEGVAEAGGKRNHQADPYLRPPFCYLSGFLAIKGDAGYRRSVIGPNQGLLFNSLI